MCAGVPQMSEQMSERTGRVPRWSLPFASALLATLSGCGSLTSELWRDYAWPGPRMSEELVERRAQEATGSLTVSSPVLENGLWWSDGEEPTPARWWLYPPCEDAAGAELAAALLADPEFCVVLAATIDARRRVVADAGIENETRLELELRLHDAAIGRPVPATEISPAAARVLATSRRDTYLGAAAPDTHLPVVYHRCAERLASVDLRRLVGQRSAVYAESWVFVDAAGHPADRIAADDAELATVASEDDAPLADRLAALSQLSLLVRVPCGTESRILRVRPDRLWLLGGLQVDGDRCVHRSSWFLQSAPRALGAPPEADALRIVTTLRLQEERYQRWLHPVVVDGGLLARIAATPVTLGLDLVLGPGAADFLRWITGKPPAADVRPRRGD
jgi:hypothetical protein